MNGSSLFDSPSDADRRKDSDLSRGLSSEESLAQRLFLEFEAPVGLLDTRTSAWVARTGSATERFPTADACLTAALGKGLNAYGRAFVWRQTREPGPVWLCLPISRERTEWLAVVGFADATEEPPTPRESTGWGRACPDRALRAWGQSVADEIRGEAFPRRKQAPGRTEGSETVLVSRLIRRMRMSDAPIQFQDLAVRAVRASLAFEVVAWVPSNTREPVVLAGSIEGFEDDDYRALVPPRNEHPILLMNEAAGEDWPDLHRYVVVAADTKSPNGWMVAINPLDNRPIGASEVELLQPIASLIGTQRANWRLYRELKEMLFGIIRSLTEAIDAKDTYTKGHSQRVARIAVKLAETIGLNAQQRGDIYLMGLLHDVGKIGVKDDVLKKTGQLTPDEYREIKRHVIIGVQILSGLTKLQHLLPAVRHHHEAFNGSGYPDALAGEQIPYEARILAVADAFDAMASDRPYRKGLSATRMEQIFREGAGRQWDPQLVEALFACWHDVAEITGKAPERSLEEAVDYTMDNRSSSRQIG